MMPVSTLPMWCISRIRTVHCTTSIFWRAKFYNYKPADILSHIDEKYTKTQTPMYVELTQLFYNSEAYPDGSPVTNIWQLTEPGVEGPCHDAEPAG